MVEKFANFVTQKRNIYFVAGETGKRNFSKNEQ